MNENIFKGLFHERNRYSQQMYSRIYGIQVKHMILRYRLFKKEVSRVLSERRKLKFYLRWRKNSECNLLFLSFQATKLPSMSYRTLRGAKEHEFLFIFKSACFLLQLKVDCTELSNLIFLLNTKTVWSWRNCTEFLARCPRQSPDTWQPILLILLGPLRLSSEVPFRSSKRSYFVSWHSDTVDKMTVGRVLLILLGPLRLSSDPVKFLLGHL